MLSEVGCLSFLARAGCTWKDSVRIVDRHSSANPFKTYEPPQALLDMQAHYERRDANRSIFGTGDPPGRSGSAASAAKRVVVPGRFARNLLAAKKIRGRSRERKVVLNCIKFCEWFMRMVWFSINSELCF